MSVRIRDVLELVCDRTGVAREQLHSASREKHVAEARAMVFHLARRHTRLGWRAIARYSTGGDASSARYLRERLLVRMALDDQLKHDVLELDQELLELGAGTEG